MLTAGRNQFDTFTRYLHGILDNLSHGILFIDSVGVITTYNGAAEALLKKNRLDILYDHYHNHFPDRFFGFSMKEALATRTAPKASLLPLSDHHEIEVHVSFADMPGGESGLILVIHDRTELNLLRRLAMRNDRMKELGEIAASVAHEIRNPLGGIKGFACLLYDDLADKPDKQKMANRIIAGADTLDRLVGNILDYTRPLQPERVPTDLVALIQDVVDTLPQEAIRIIIRKAFDSCTIPIDRPLIQSAIQNIIQNASDSMPNGGDIIIELHKWSNRVLIQVRDSGCGIAEENLERIFTPFFTTKAKGNGFGLSEANKAILAHEGTIDATSSLGQGTVITITLPYGGEAV